MCVCGRVHRRSAGHRRPQRSKSPPRPAGLATLSPRKMAFERPVLLMQLSHFEAYSADCAHRSAADAELHAYLRQVASASRVRFESALDHVALHEGLILPASAMPGDVAVASAARRAKPLRRGAAPSVVSASSHLFEFQHGEYQTNNQQ